MYAMTASRVLQQNANAAQEAQGSRKIYLGGVGGPWSPFSNPPPMEGAPKAGSLFPCFHACVEQNGARHVQDNKIYNTGPPNKGGTQIP